MSLRNIVFQDYVCPRCSAKVETGFEIDEGDQFQQYIYRGDQLGSASEKLPEGRWRTDGVGLCYTCGLLTEAWVEFDGNVFLGITDLGEYGASVMRGKYDVDAWDESEAGDGQ